MEGFALADNHRRQQVKLTADVQRLLAEVYRRTIDPTRLDATFPLYLAAASRVLGQGRAASDVLARRYYMKAATEAGFRPVGLDVPAAPMNLEAVETSLRVTGPVTVKTQVSKGVPLVLANQLGLAATIAAGKRIMLDAGREMLVQAGRRDPNVDAWARVSDGSTCAFCAMLVSRGPVYSEATVSFRSHDRCGCGVRLVFKGEKDRGWSQDAAALNRLWKGTDDPEREEDSTLTLKEWRSILAAARKDPDSPLNKPAKAPLRAVA
jgi:hypothetical protein